MKCSAYLIVAAIVATASLGARSSAHPVPASASATPRWKTLPALKVATTIQSAPALESAIAVMPFAEGTIYRLQTAPERVSDLVLEPGESLSAVASGDTARWTIGDTSSGAGAAKQVHVLVKPFAAGLSTNLVITTDRRTYRIALVSTAGSAMAGLSWVYPQDAPLALRHQQAAVTATPVASGIELERLRFDYIITGDRPNWRPLRAFDDGRQTFIEFPPSIAVFEAPPLFVVGEKGAAQLLNYRMRGRYYVVDRLFDVAELRLGTKHQQIVRIVRTTGNRSDAPVGGNAS